MIFSIIIKTLLTLAGLLLLCIFVISKLNRTSAQIDKHQYDKNFDPYEPLSGWADKNKELEEFDDTNVKFYKRS